MVSAWPFELVDVGDIMTLPTTELEVVLSNFQLGSQCSTAIFTKWRVVAEAPSRCPTIAALRFAD